MTSQQRAGSEPAYPGKVYVETQMPDAPGISVGEWMEAPGLTKRELFAAMAMQGILACNHPVCRELRACQSVSTTSVLMADTLIAELEKAHG